MTHLNLSLSPDLESYVRQRAREYPSLEEYLRDLIQREHDNRAEYEKKLAELRAELDIGIKESDQGLSRPLDMRKIKSEARREFEHKHALSAER